MNYYDRDWYDDLDWRERRNDNRNTWIAVGIGALIGVAGLAWWQSRQDDGDDRFPDNAPGRAARQIRFGDYAVTGRTVTINKPRSEVYAFWRDFSNLPAFMENVEAVSPTGEDTNRWSIAGPMGRSIDLETRIVEDRKDELIAWSATENADIETHGKVMFRDAPGGRGTEVEAIIAYVPPMGELGRWVATLFQKEPAIQGRRELKRLKMLLETGEIATSRINRTAA